MATTWSKAVRVAASCPGVLTAATVASVAAASAGRVELSLAASAVAALACTVLLLRRAWRTPAERGVWLRWAAGAPAVAVGLALDQLGMPLVGGIVVVAVYPLAYGASVRWNRVATTLADPHEAINGFGAAVGLLAVLELGTQWAGAPVAALPWSARLMVLAPPACAFIIIATLASIIPAAGLVRDPRAWLMLCAAVLVLVLTVGPLLGSPSSLTSAVLALTAWCTGIAGHRPPTDAPARPVDASASTVGGFGVIVVCLAVLCAAGVLGVPGPGTWLAAAGGFISSVRLLRNVQDIAALDVSRHEALTDDLTGIPNRRALLRRAQLLLDGGRRPLVLAVIDLDGFKQINDALGHAAGDELLRQMAGRLARTAGAGLLGRLGGDEFAIVAPVPATGSVVEHVDRLAAGILDALSHPVDIAGLLVHGSGSVGLTSVTEGAPDLSELLRQADAAMYEAKAARGTAVVYDPVRHGSHGRLLLLLEELRTALTDGQLTLHHQPQVDVVTGQLLGVEALVRWEHPTRGLLLPAAFLGLAESQGLMTQLTDRVLGLAVEQLASWRRAGLGLRMSVNLSASNLLDIGLPERVRALLAQHGVPADRLTLEVTETVLVQDQAGALQTLTSLTKAGVEVSIDDYGTGWSSLAYLRALPATELKLDASFTSELTTDPKTAAIVASTVDLAHELGLRVVAEGVEDTATLHRLAAIGCDVSQGYLHSRPLAAADLLAWARRRRGELVLAGSDVRPGTAVV